jgi:hypothetical protein
VSSLTLAAVAFGGPAHAVSLPPAHIKLSSQSNSAVNVDTQLDCTRHELTAQVTNKTSGNITPNVTFNKQQPNVLSTLPIGPGKTANYYFDFSGNNMLVNVEVDVDTFAPVKLMPMLNCSEPVSFTVTDYSKSAVTGVLQNNNTLLPQTVLTRVNAGDVRVENLQPGEARLIALPFTPVSSAQNSAMVTIATTGGYEGTYFVDLTAPIVYPLGK